MNPFFTVKSAQTQDDISLILQKQNKYLFKQASMG